MGTVNSAAVARGWRTTDSRVDWADNWRMGRKRRQRIRRIGWIPTEAG
jgi:hypothetical protein